VSKRKFPEGGKVYVVLTSFVLEHMGGSAEIPTVDGVLPDGWLPIFIDPDEAKRCAKGAQVLEVIAT
jgi:hypothetical protein